MRNDQLKTNNIAGDFNPLHEKLIKILKIAEDLNPLL